MPEDDNIIKRKEYENGRQEVLVRLKSIDGELTNIESKNRNDATNFGDRIKALETRMIDMFRAADIAVSKRDDANNVRLDRMNEMRDQINTERSTYETKEHSNAMFEALRSEIRAQFEALRSDFRTSETKTEGAIESLKITRGRNEGSFSTANVITGFLIAGLGVVATLLIVFH